MSDLTSNKNNDINTVDDEISLVDLLVVILKRRWLILGLTFAAVIIGIAFYLVTDRKIDHMEVEERVFIDFSIPMNIRSFIDNPENLVLQIFRDPWFFLETMEVSEIQTLSEMGIELKDYEDYNLLQTITQRVIGNISRNGTALKAEEQLYKVLSKGNGRFTIWIKTTDREKVTLYLRHLIKVANADSFDLFSTLAETEVRNFEEYIGLEYDKSQLEVDLMRAFYKYNEAKTFLSQKPLPLVVEREYSQDLSVINKEELKDNLRTKVVIIVIAVFFLSVFLAFILNAVENVKKDPVASEKIRQALGKKVE